jgi:hypothetical protein
MPELSKNDFLTKLKQEAQLQAKLEATRFIPVELDFLTSFVGKHPWQVLVVSSGIISLALELMKFII